MSFAPDYIKTLSKVNQEPEASRKLRERNMNTKRLNAQRQIEQVERENDTKWGLGKTS